MTRIRESLRALSLAAFVAAAGCAFEVDDFCTTDLDCGPNSTCNQDPSLGTVNQCIAGGGGQPDLGADMGAVDMGGNGEFDMGPTDLGPEDMGMSMPDMGPVDMGMEEVDECAQGLDDCGQFTQCVDEAEGFRCECLPGFEPEDSSTTECEPLPPSYAWAQPPWATQNDLLDRLTSNADRHGISMKADGDVGIAFATFENSSDRSIWFVDETDVKMGLTRASTVAVDSKWQGSFDVELGPTGEWVVAYVVADSEGEPTGVKLRRRVDGAWEDWLGTFEFEAADAEPARPRVAFGPSGEVFLAVENWGDFEDLFVFRWDGDAFDWVMMGGGQVQSDLQIIYDIDVDSQGRPVVAFNAIPSFELQGGVISVRRWVEGEGWVRYAEDEPANLLPSPLQGSPLRVRIRLDREDRPVVLWEVDRPDPRPEFDYWTVFLEGLKFDNGKWEELPDMRNSNLMGRFPRNPSLQLDYADRPVAYFMADESIFDTFLGAYILSDGRWESTAPGGSRYFGSDVWARAAALYSAQRTDPQTLIERACVIHASDTFDEGLTLYCSERSLIP